jgi:hypothetical protein
VIWNEVSPGLFCGAGRPPPLPFTAALAPRRACLENTYIPIIAYQVGYHILKVELALYMHMYYG